jgi:hypothetical protein
MIEFIAVAAKKEACDALATFIYRLASCLLTRREIPLCILRLNQALYSVLQKYFLQASPLNKTKPQSRFYWADASQQKLLESCLTIELLFIF